MYINFINDRKDLGFMCLRDIEAGEQVTVILVTGVVCIGIFLNSRLFLNEENLVNRSYSNRRSRPQVFQIKN